MSFPQKSPKLLRTSSWICLLLLFLSLALLFFLQLYTTDDYLYISFFDHGLRGFAQQMRWHYAHMNGRILIHSFPCLVLHFGHWAVALFAMGTLSGIYLLGIKLCKGKLLSVSGAVIFLSGLMLLPRKILLSGVYWVSAFYNYVFPILLLLALLLLRGKLREGTKHRGLTVLAMLAAALCAGGSTELFGLLSCGVLGLFLLDELRGKQKDAWLTGLALVFAMVGLFLIFLSPATRQRAGVESKLTLDAILRELNTQSKLLRDCAALTLPFVLLQAGLAVHGGKPDKPWLPLLSLSAIAVWGLIFILPQDASGNLAYPVLLAILLAEAVVFSGKHQQGLAVLLLCAPMCMIIMSATKSSGYRTLAAFSVFQLLALAVCVNQIVGFKNLRALLAILMTVGAMTIFIMDVPHYQHNWSVDEKNHQQMTQGLKTGNAEISMDYDMNYMYRCLYTPDSASCLDWYLKWIGFNRSKTRIHISGHTTPSINFNGKDFESFSAFFNLEKTLYPLKDLAAELGAEYENTANDLITIRWNGVSYRFTTDRDPEKFKNTIVQWTDLNDESHYYETRSHNSLLTGEKYLDQEALEYIFGFEFERTADKIYIRYDSLSANP